MQAPRPRPQSCSSGGSYRDTYFSSSTDMTTDFDRFTWKQKPVTGPEFYDRSLLSKKFALVGVFISACFSVGCIVCSAEIFLSKNAISAGVVVVPLTRWWQRELVSLGLNLLVATCTEATGFVHAIALRSALSAERRLRFNTNLRLLTAASSIFGPNGTLCNALMSILLIVSYSSSILVTLSVNMKEANDALEDDNSPTQALCVSDVPLLVLGITLLLQVIIAILGMIYADIQTWSSSAFDITAALVHHAQVVPIHGRCMRGVKDADMEGPIHPRVVQPSAWSAHP
ncbi:hypothetical protein ID866_5322, partial [Astraeus odoratus]